MRLFMSAPSRKRTAHLVAAMVLVTGGLFQGSSARGDYTLALQISDTFGTTVTITQGGLTGPGSLGLNDFGGSFPEFASLRVSATSLQGPTSSFLDKVEVSGAVNPGFEPFDLTISLTGSGFTSPGPLVDATQTLSTSSPDVAFTSLTQTGTLNGLLVGDQLESPPGSGTIHVSGLDVGMTYDAVLTQTFHEIQPTEFGIQGEGKLLWTAGTVPEPASLVLVLTGLPVLVGRIVGRWHRKVRKPR